ncbi:MAG: STAS domain-containing protein [Bacteroidota bacterium]
MKYSYELKHNIGVYNLAGNLIGEDDGVHITDSFAQEIGNGTSNFVIDLTQLQHINSSGLGVLITLLTKARKAGGEVVLAGPSDFIKNLLVMTKLNTIFTIYASAEEAMGAYA